LFDVFLDYFKKLLKSRLFPITLIYIALFSVVINRLFVLQIIEGPSKKVEAELKDTNTREIKSTRGNIYDRNGKLLASNVLSYSVMMEDSTKIESNQQRNKIIFELIQIIEKNGDTLDNEFYIRQTESGEYEFTIEGSALTRFKKNVYAYVLTEDNELEEKDQNATAKDVYEFLRNGTGNAYTRMFEISDEYSVEDTLKIMSVRYALFCNYPKYYQIPVASKVSDATVAAVSESNAELLGVEIQQQSHRVYNDSIYLAHIMGYTGLISEKELDQYDAESDYYNSTDVIGKSGLEKKYETELGGTKGSELLSVGPSGKVVDVLSRTEPMAGNDIYLTIDSDLQRSSYHLLEKEIARILISKLKPTLDYGSKGESASEITIPIYEVYFALINNNIIDVTKFEGKDEKSLEGKTYIKYQSALTNIFAKLDTLLSTNNTVTNDKAGDMEDYLDYFYSVLISNDILLVDLIPQDDQTFVSYKNDKVTLSKFLQYAIANNWIDLSKLNVGIEYNIVEEIYDKLITYTKNILKNDSIFNKKIYHTLIFSYNLSGTEICLLLFDQGVLEYKEQEEDINKLKNGGISAYDFMYNKLTSLEITPAMLALEPCSGSLVITDVNNGDVLALVTYPSYDNNRFANKVDSKYYSQLLNDKSYPLINRPAMERTAPGSTFKMVTSFAALEEGVVTPSETINDLGEFDKISPSPKCHIHPGSHGLVDIVDALKVSCNYYFYEIGWRLSIDSTGKYVKQLGLDRLAKYATLFGLNQTSGIELYEETPKISNSDPVRSAIGQGTNIYTPIQLSRYITTLANRGTNYNLTLLNKIVAKDGKVTINNANVNQDLTKMSASTWDSVREGMYSVVNENNGSVFGLYNNFGITVAGKTGTSQISKVNPNNALFVSFAPYEDPEISVTAVIPKGYTSSNAAELSKDIYKLYFNLEEIDELLEGDVTITDTNNSTAIE
jgi:penicillin-binding protein 2